METTVEISEEQRRENVDKIIKKHISSKRHEIRESKKRFRTDPEVIKAFQRLEQRNAERGTPIANL
jgi:phosphatidylserine/phosphatidylglycerophosphate/cardiolipin synthase-like enzyme